MTSMINANIISFAVDKGGTGKTTTTLNVAAGLAARGFRVLALDADQQANLTSVLLQSPPEFTMYDALLDEDVPLPVVNVRQNLDLVPACHRMFGVGIRLISRQLHGGEHSPDCRGILSRKLEPLKRHYDFILLDCPPSDNILMINALYATDYVVIVAHPEPFCVEGVLNFGKIMRTMKDDANKGLRLAGVLITDFETGSPGHQKGEDALRRWAPKFVFATHIRHSRPLYNSILAHQDIFTYAPDSNGARDYSDYIDEFLIKVNKQ